MKRIFVLSVLTLFCLSLTAQETKEFILNSYFQKIHTSKFASYTRKVQQQDTLWAYTDYGKDGSLVQTGFFTDTNFTTPAGHTVFYQYKVKLYEGDYLNGRPAGYWYFFDAAGNLSDSLFYAFRDTPKKTALFKDPLATQKYNALKNEHLKKDTSAPAFSLETPPGFPGGMPAWRKYLERNLHIPELVLRSCPYSKGTVQVQFVVCNDGEICSVQALNSVHPLVDLIAVKAIRKGPKWEPAMQKGRNVKAYQRQPITFMLQEY